MCELDRGELGPRVADDVIEPARSPERVDAFLAEALEPSLEAPGRFAARVRDRVSKLR